MVVLTVGAHGVRWSGRRIRGFGRLISARELQETFTPTTQEIAWARDSTRSEPHLLALVVLLKSTARLGYFPDLYEVPFAVVDHICGVLECKPEVEAVHDSERTLRHHKGLVRARLSIVADPGRARALAETTLREAAATKGSPG